VIYHGTLIENLCRIAARGLAPDPVSGYLWLSPEYRVAAQWATNRAARWIGSELRHAPHTVLRSRVSITTLPDPNLPSDLNSVVTTETISPDDLDVVASNLWSKRPRWKSLRAWALEHCQRKSATQLDHEIAAVLRR
jgi:hypothetical protein